MKRILFSVAGLLLCGACAEYPDGADVKRERFGIVFSNFSVAMPKFELSEDSVHEYRFKRVSFHGGEAIVRFIAHLPSSVAYKTLDTVVTVAIWEVGKADSLVYRYSAPLNGIFAENEETQMNAWHVAYSSFYADKARTHLGGEEWFTAEDFAELSSWKEYRLKVTVAHPEVNNALSEASAFVQLDSTSK